MASVLASLPSALRARLRSALTALDVEAIQHVLDEIGRLDGMASDTLRVLIANYQYGPLLRIIDDIDSEEFS